MMPTQIAHRISSLTFTVQRIFVGICIIVSILCSRSLAGAEPKHESLESIYQAVKDYLRQQIDTDTEATVIVSELDSRLKLVSCEKPLAVFLNNNNRPAGRVTAGVSCMGSKPWTVYLPAEISIIKSVFATTHPLPRGYALTENDLTTVRVNVGDKRMAYYTRKEDVLGMIVKRPIRSGVLLSASLLEPRHLVHRGEHVTLLAETGSLKVRMKGKALSDGAQGDVIQVRNLSSQRIVEGIVTDTGLIQVSM